MESKTPAHSSSYGTDDLASIILSARPPRARSIAGWEALGEPHSRQGYDARSVLVLIIVVAALAAVVGWTMTATRQSLSSPNAGSSGPKAAPAAAGDRPAAKVGINRRAHRGVDLAVGRVTSSRATNGSTLLRTTVRNSGGDPTGASSIEVMFLLDGERLGTTQVSSIKPGSSRVAQLSLGSCPGSSGQVLAIVDPTGSASDQHTSDNATMRHVTFDC